MLSSEQAMMPPSRQRQARSACAARLAPSGGPSSIILMRLAYHACPLQRYDHAAPAELLRADHQLITGSPCRAQHERAGFSCLSVRGLVCLARRRLSWARAFAMTSAPSGIGAAPWIITSLGGMRSTLSSGTGF